MDRRTFVMGSALVVAFAPLGARAQQRARVYRVGILEAVPESQSAANLEALKRGLATLGYVEGQNLLVEYRSSDGHAERFPGLAADMARLKVDIIVTRGTPATTAAKNAAGTVPIVMATMGDPRRIVTSFARPGGNVTGMTTFSTELTAKRLELLKELVPNLSRVALLHNMSNAAAAAEWDEIRSAARSLGLQFELLDVRSQGDIDRAFEIAARQHVEALVVGADGLTQMHRQAIVDLVGRAKLPATYPTREFVDDGGLISYSVNYPELYFRLATFIDKIFRGAKPGELPVEQPARFELVINLKAARTLGLAIPKSLLIRADAVVQ